MVSPTSHPAVPRTPQTQSMMLELETSRSSDTQRLRQLFEMAPVALLVEDYTQVAHELLRLAAEGVTDLEAHLIDSPELLNWLIAHVTIVDANPAAIRLLGADCSRQVCGPVNLDTLTDEASQAFLGQFIAIWEGRLSWDTTFNGADAHGSPIPAHLGLSIPHDDGVPDYAHAMVSITDVSELMNTQRDLQELVRWKDEFTARVAHELRTPLTGLVGLAEALRSHAELIRPEEIPELISCVADQAVELQRLVDDLLVAARSEVGHLEVVPEPIMLRSLADEAARSVATHIEISGSAPLAMADPIRVRQVIRNLITNATRYGGPVRRVEVGTTGAGAYVDVLDDGTEIASARREAMFEPFERVGRTTMTGSVGLGLSVARTLARAQGGDLTYERRGAWNVFRLTLPVPE